MYVVKVYANCLMKVHGRRHNTILMVDVISFSFHEAKKKAEKPLRKRAVEKLTGSWVDWCVLVPVWGDTMPFAYDCYA